MFLDCVPSPKSRRAGHLRPEAERLEGRALLSAAPPTLVVESASTADSRSVTVVYQVQNAPLPGPVTFGIDRSADGQIDATAETLGSVTRTLDDNGQPASAVGTHQLTVLLPQGLPPDPARPFVMAVADPAHALTGVTETQNTASFRTYVIGVVTHGGLQPQSWRAGVPWELRMAHSLKADGYDAVIPYNWVAVSSNPGAAAKQGPIVARLVREAASQFPAGAPVEVPVIGHSEGAVVNSLAILGLNQNESPELHSGYVDETMLDPHAGNNHAPGGQQFSTPPGLFGTIAEWVIQGYQAEAKDPLPVVPPNVDAAEVFFEHTPIADAKDSNDGLYNLWGQVPVRTEGVPIHYYDLTGRGISHAGEFSVPDWYEVHVVPTLADDSSFEDPTLLTGTLAGGGTTTTASQATYQGAAAPGAKVALFAAPVGSSHAVTLGRTTADPSGNWSLTTRPAPRRHLPRDRPRLGRRQPLLDARPGHAAEVPRPADRRHRPGRLSGGAQGLEPGTPGGSSRPVSR